MHNGKLSIVIPNYNEEKTILQIIDKILKLNWPIALELVIVDDCSRDKSRELLSIYQSDKRFKLIFNEQNLGKSRSVKKGILATTGDLIVVQDADLEYEPANLLDFIKLFQTHDLDIVYGNRFGKNNKFIYVGNWIGNRALSLFSSLFTWFRNGMWTQDMECCYKMVKGEVLRAIAPKFTATSNFGIEPEITARLSRYKPKLKFAELPIDYYPRTIAEGKHMRGISDGTKALLEILKYNLFKK